MDFAFHVVIGKVQNLVGSIFFSVQFRNVSLYMIVIFTVGKKIFSFNFEYETVDVLANKSFILP